MATHDSHPSGAVTPENQLLILFGANGDLAKRKLIPGFFHLAVAGMMPNDYRIIGTGRPGSHGTTESFRAHARSAVDEFGEGAVDTKEWDAFAGRLQYASSSAEEPEALVDAVERAEKNLGNHLSRLIYLAVPPNTFGPLVTMLGDTGLADNAKLVIEKPFGHDLASARELNHSLRDVFEEEQIYRIDHFLGKESVQNMLAFRFGNGLFESLWNREHIASIQIDVPEKLTIEGRAGFYEHTGAFRDMVVTHLLHLLGFIAMEAPERLDAQSLHEQAQRVFDAITPLDPSLAVFGQYEGYLQEPGVASDSNTDTFAAVTVLVDNPRWTGVPFYLRTGKGMAESRHTVTVRFADVAQSLFSEGDGQRGSNELVFELTEPESISMRFCTKVPGTGIRLANASLQFRYESSFSEENSLRGYERLIHDVMIEDHLLFTQAEGIERLWEVGAAILARQDAPLKYSLGSWGPAQADKLVPDGWHLPEQQHNGAPQQPQSIRKTSRINQGEHS